MRIIDSTFKLAKESKHESKYTKYNVPLVEVKKGGGGWGLTNKHGNLHSVFMCRCSIKLLLSYTFKLKLIIKLLLQIFFQTLISSCYNYFILTEINSESTLIFKHSIFRIYELPILY